MSLEALVWWNLTVSLMSAFRHATITWALADKKSCWQFLPAVQIQKGRILKRQKGQWASFWRKTCSFGITWVERTIPCAIRRTTFSIPDRNRTSRIRLRLWQSHKKARFIMIQILQLVTSQNSKFFLVFHQHFQYKPGAFTDLRSLSRVPQKWTRLGCQRFAGRSIDCRNTKLRALDSHTRRFWLLVCLLERLVPSPGPWPGNAIVLEGLLKHLKYLVCILSKPHTKIDCVSPTLVSKNTLHAEARLSSETARSELVTGYIERVNS